MLRPNGYFVWKDSRYNLKRTRWNYLEPDATQFETLQMNFMFDGGITKENEIIGNNLGDLKIVWYGDVISDLLDTTLCSVFDANRWRAKCG